MGYVCLPAAAKSRTDRGIDGWEAEMSCACLSKEVTASSSRIVGEPATARVLIKLPRESLPTRLS